MLFTLIHQLRDSGASGCRIQGAGHRHQGAAGCGLEIGPVVAGGVNSRGVELFVHGHHGLTMVTHVLDAATFAAIEQTPTPVGLPGLPTLAQWATQSGSTALPT
jgi:hypothetical protein